MRQAVVIAREDEGGDKRLVAYVVPERESEESNNGSGRVGLQISELREHLLDKLPEYMVPSAYVQLEALPLNHNGKIDRKSLPEPDKDIPEPGSVRSPKCHRRNSLPAVARGGYMSAGTCGNSRQLF